MNLRQCLILFDLEYLYIIQSIYQSNVSSKQWTMRAQKKQCILCHIHCNTIVRICKFAGVVPAWYVMLFYIVEPTKKSIRTTMLGTIFVQRNLHSCQMAIYFSGYSVSSLLHCLRRQHCFILTFQSNTRFGV